jgi:O-antigen ligase
MDRLFSRFSSLFVFADPTTQTSWRLRLAWLLAGLGLAYHGFFAMTDIGKVKTEYGAILVFVASVLAGPTYWRELFRLRFFRWTLVFVAYALLQCWWVSHTLPGVPSFNHQLSAAGDPARVGLFASVLAIWLARQRKWIVPMLGLMLIGYLMMLCIYGGHSWAAFDGDEALLRLRLSYSENIGGLFAAELLVIVGSALLYLRLGHRHAPMPRRRSWLVALLLISPILFACLLLAQSRGAWLAALVGGTVMLTGTLRGVGAHIQRISGRRLLLSLAAGLVVCAALLPLIMRVGEQRLNGMDVVLSPLLEQGIQAVPNTSVGLRLHLYMLGFHTFTEHPLVGIGLRSIYPLITASGIREGIYVPPHLHDSYLEILVGLGLLGAAILTLAVLGVWRRAWRAYRNGVLPLGWFWLLAGWFAVLLVDISMDDHIWRFDYLRSTLEILLAITIALSLPARTETDGADAVALVPPATGPSH